VGGTGVGAADHHHPGLLSDGKAAVEFGCDGVAGAIAAHRRRQALHVLTHRHHHFAQGKEGP
jgi:hypothetical protein